MIMSQDNNNLHSLASNDMLLNGSQYDDNESYVQRASTIF